MAQPYLQAAAKEGKERVVMIGIAQEKASVWRSWPRKGQEKARHPHMDWGREMAFINHFYFYLWDPEWGAAFWKTNAYAPYPIWICLLTELRGQNAQVRRQLGALAATVAAHDRKRCAAGSRGLGGG